MEDINIELKPKKKSYIDKIKELFVDKNKRSLYVVLFILPFLVAIGIFGFITYREAKKLLSLATDVVETKEENSIQSMDYILRDNATDYQKELFAELKLAVEVDNASPETIVGLVAKNYVADFYTWTNKQGQYDVGGMYYVCSEKNETTKYKQNIYTKARDGFYKYINNYIKEYGATNLIEVENIEVTTCNKSPNKYTLYEFIRSYQPTPESEWVVEYDYVNHDAYLVKLKWSYKEGTKLNVSDFGNSINLLIIENDGRYEIVEASENPIDASQFEEKS